MADLTWNPQMPSAAGVYWFRSPASMPTLCRIEYEGDPKDVEICRVYFIEDDERFPLEESIGAEWAGPLTPPA